MSYNGIGLQTARGSGTNGYVTKSKAFLRVRDGPPGGQFGFKDFTETDSGPPIHRAPDAAIMEHERKRKVEVKCFELQEQLEEDGVDEDEILNQVGELRTKLTAQMAAGTGPRLRATDSHGIAMAKQEEMERLRNAFGVSGQYKEGSAFIRETDEEKAQRYAEREERDRIKAQEIVARELEAEKREKERVEREKLRRREEYYKKQQGSSKPPAPSSSTLPPKPPRQSRSDVRRHDDSPRGRSRSRSPLPYSKETSPPPKRRRSPVDSRSRSPSPKRRARSPTDSRSPSPVRRKADSRSRSPVRRRRSPSDSRSRSRSPVRTRRRSSTPPPPRRR